MAIEQSIMEQEEIQVYIFSHENFERNDSSLGARENFKTESRFFSNTSQHILHLSWRCMK
jgi:hypothetical protein